METLRLTKHQALGNDFLIALMQPHEKAALDSLRLDWPALTSQLCDRSCGIGADGLILAVDTTATQPSADQDALKTDSAKQVRQVRMTLFNSDGSSAEVSGNGLACLANEVACALVSSMEFGEVVEAPDSLLELTVDTVDGARRVTLSAEFATTESGSVEPVKSLAEVHMPKVAPGPSITTELDDLISVRFDEAARGTGDVGNPHLVVAAGVEIDEAETARLGELYERYFPESAGINVEFIWPFGDDGKSLGMSVWERGAGLTQACGTGAVTAAVRAQDWGLVAPDTETVVAMRGGTATVSFDADDSHPILSVWVEPLGDHEWPIHAPLQDA